MAQISTTSAQTSVIVNNFVRSVYNWMAIGLGLTGFVAFYVSSNPVLLRFFSNPVLLIFLVIAELGLVFAISGMVNRMSSATATSLFVIYAALNGITLSFIFIIYTSTSIASTFFVCAGTFIACSIYGWVTKKDLTSFGGFLIMGLIGIIIATIVNMFLNSTMLSMMISYIGVFIFVGLTAYDTQKIKNMALTQPRDLDGGAIRKGAILGALSLYLDFINLFLFFLRIMGVSRD